MRKRIPAHEEITCDVCKRELASNETVTRLEVNPSYSEETCEAEYDLCPSCATKFNRFLLQVES